MTTTRCTTKGQHCEECGSTSAEDIGFAAARANDGYSACCNQIIASGPADCRNHHGEED